MSKTIIICDKNKELIKKVKKLIKENKKNKAEITLKAHNMDILKCKKKYPNAKIVTASNPSFNARGGLDLILKNMYPTEWEQAKEFNFTDNLFFTISVNKYIKSTKKIIQRALIGIYAYRHIHDFILTGIGTAIGGLKENDFINELQKILNNNLKRSDLKGCNLKGSDLKGSDLSESDLSESNLRWSNLSESDLRWSNLSKSDLRWSNLSKSNLSESNLSESDLSESNLSESKNFPNNNHKFLKDFKKTNKGYIVYKAFGNTFYTAPKEWKLKKDSIITEICNPNKQNECGCGVNFGTLNWIKENLEKENIEVWECLLLFEDMINLCVPYNYDGKARCEKLKLIKKV